MEAVETVTLEALLDAPGLSPVPPSFTPVKSEGTPLPNTPSLQLSESDHLDKKTGIKHHLTEQIFVPHPTKIPHSYPEAQVKDACFELVRLLIQQDSNRLFQFPPKINTGKKQGYESRLSLQWFERQVVMDKIGGLTDLRRQLEEFFTDILDDSPLSSLHYSEATRLMRLLEEWFFSLRDVSLLSIRLPTSLPHEAKSGEDSLAYTSLSILNPDNRGLVSETQRVRTIGEEVGGLLTGCHLSQCGAYREDRRNKVTPYSYLNYGPYSSFAPTYDSGASSCTAAENELLLGTLWLPSRLAYLSDDWRSAETSSPDWTALFAAASRLGDQELITALADAEEEWQQGRDLAEEVLPISGDHFHLCLADAITRHLPQADSSDESLSSSFSNDDKISYPAPIEGPDEKPLELMRETEGDTAQNLLTESAVNLRALYNAQYRRLMDFSPQSMLEERCLKPSTEESDNAQKVIGNLIEMIRNTRPGDVVSRSSLRKVLRIGDLQSDEDIDPDSLLE